MKLQIICTLFSPQMFDTIAIFSENLKFQRKYIYTCCAQDKLYLVAKDFLVGLGLLFQLTIMKLGE